MVVGVWFLPLHYHIPCILLVTGRRTSTETCGLDIYPPDARLETHFMFDIHIPKSLYCIVRNRASCSAAYFVYKLLYKSDYFTSP